MNRKTNSARIQGAQYHGNKANDYQFLQDEIAKHGVECSVLKTPVQISIRILRTKSQPSEDDYANFLIAKTAIKGRTSLPIVIDIFEFS